MNSLGANEAGSELIESQRLTWEKGGPSAVSWRQHIKGAAQVLRLRGRSQIRTRTGAALFRDLRDLIVRAVPNDDRMHADVETD